MFQTKTMCIVDKSYKTWTLQEYTIMKGVFDEKKKVRNPWSNAPNNQWSSYFI